MAKNIGVVAEIGRKMRIPLIDINIWYHIPRDLWPIVTAKGYEISPIGIKNSALRGYHRYLHRKKLEEEAAKEAD